MKFKWRDTNEFMNSGEAGFEIFCGGRADGYITNWPDYIATIPEKNRPHFEALREWFVRNGPVYGMDHQDHALPVFEDGSFIFSTLRCWGEMVSCALNGDSDGPYSYGDFAWCRDEFHELPAGADITKE